MQSVLIYTDGASKGNPGKGGYGIIWELEGTNHRKEFCEGFRLTTNNRMELLAVIEGLKMLKRACKVTIFSDSKYVTDAVNQGWIFNWERKEFNKVKNSDLWREFLAEYRKHSVKFIWIKGHNQHPQNERCDYLASNIAQSENLSVDVYFENEINSLQIPK